MSESLLEQIRGPLNERQQKSVRIIEDSGRHLLDLINDLLDLSKIEAGKLELYPEIVSVSTLCLASLQFVREIALKKNIQVAYVNPQLDTQFRVDPKRFKQMLVNLLSNAVKFTPDGGQVTLSVTLDLPVQLIHFAVQDNGIGIAPTNQAKLFQPFTQLDSQLSRQYEGTGLGLVLVKKLAEQQGGAVCLESTGIPGQGSRFTISLPYEFDSLQLTTGTVQPELGVVPSATISGSGPLILLVEDNEINIQVMEDYLLYAGYQLIVARTGIEALEKVTATMPSLILMDIQLPLLDGLEVTRRLRAQARFATTPIIALTALAMSGDRERCLAAGATDYLSKPLHLKELLAMIKKLIAPQPILSRES